MNRAGLAAIGALLMTGTAAEAVLMGDTVTCSASGFTCSAPAATVGTSAEFIATGLLTNYTINFLSDGISLTSGAISLPLSLANGTSLSFTNMTSPFTGASLRSSTGLSVSSATPIVSLVNGVVTVNMSNLALVGSNTILIATSPSGTSSGSVPEPAAWVLMLAGFGLVGYTLRSQRINVVDLALIR
jgi:hypothetical protein